MKQMSYVLILLLALMLFVSPVSVIAQQQSPTATPGPETGISTLSSEQPLEGPDIYSFASLGLVDRVLNGPYDSMQVRFSMPDTWALNNDAAVQLHIKNIFTASAGLSENEIIQATGATLDVELNGIWLTTVVLDWSGERMITIPFNPRSLMPTTPGQHYLGLYLNADIDCQFQHQTTVAVFADSRLNLVHDTKDPVIDLSLFPGPIFQKNSFLPNDATLDYANFPMALDSNSAPAILVTSDAPDAAELQAALTVSAGLGRLSAGNLPITTLQVSQLTEALMQSAHLIYVGKGAGFQAFADVKLPAPYDGAKFTTPGAEPEDGLIQEAVSPWDPSKVILVVSGETDAGIIKAAQAVSSGIIRAGESADLAVVSGLSPVNEVTSVPTDRTLESLGYEPVQMVGVGYRTQDYLFFIPPGQTLQETGKFQLMFTNSALLDSTQSSISVLINNQSVGGIPYTTDSSRTTTTTEVSIPGYLLRSGMNRLSIQIEQIPQAYCSNTILNNLWTNISNQSVLHLPLIPATDLVEQRNLTNPTSTITRSPDLDSVAFVVAPESPIAVKSALQIAYHLGSQMTGNLVKLRAAYGSQVPDDFRKQSDLVLVGRASQISIIDELNPTLPAPFEKGSDVAQEAVFEVIYRIPANVSVGYIQLVETPWDPDRSILAVLGSTDQGVADAANALTVPTIRKKLAGNFAAVRNEQVITADSRLGIGTGNISATLVPEAQQITQEATLQVAPEQVGQVPFANQTTWVLPVVGVISLLIVGVIVIVFLSSRRKQ